MTKADRRIKFTKLTLDKLPLPEAKASSSSSVKEYWYDTKVDGLALRVTSTGSKSFLVYKWDAYTRKPVRIQLGKYVSEAGYIDELEKGDPLSLIGKNPSLSVDQAQRLAKAVIGSPQEVVNRQAAKEKKLGELTLGDMFDVYMTYQAKSGKKRVTETQAEYERDLAHWSNRRLSDITHSDCEALHTELGRRRPGGAKRYGFKGGPYTANRRIQLLAAIFNLAIKKNLFDGKNPAADVTYFPEEKRKRFLSPVEALRLWQVLSATKYVDIRDFIKLALYTGARRTNIVSMRWDRIDWQRKTWFIPASESKNGKEQYIPLTANAIALLTERKHNVIGPWVFPGTGKSGHLEDPSKVWQRIRKEADIPDVRIHDLRRSVASMMANSGVNVPIISGALGHGNIRTTLEVYAQTEQDAQREALEKIQSQYSLIEQQTPSPAKVVQLAKPKKKSKQPK